MPRKASNTPWLHAPSSFWCITFNGRREYLDKDYDVACLKVRDLQKQARQADPTRSQWLNASFSLLADEYLSDIQARRSPATYTSCRYRLHRALEVLGTALRVGEFKKIHLARVERALAGKGSPTTLRDTLASVQAVFNWAVKHDLLDTNPLAGYEKPAARCRNRIIQAHEFQALLRHSDPNFRRVLLALRLTGCRPGEIRSLIWQWVDLRQGLWILPEHKTVTRQRNPRPRIIPLPEPILKLCRWLARRPHAENEQVFLNKYGRPYQKDTFVRKMQRVRSRAGLQAIAGEQLVLYSARHSFCTSALGRVTDTELAELMGHTSIRLLQRYSHLNTDRLRDIQRRAQQ